MTNSIALCGLDCAECGMKDQCSGCAPTGGRPFGGTCMLAACCQGKGQERCAPCGSFEACGLKAQLIAEFNALGIADMPEVTDLAALAGSFINLEYGFPGGQKAKLWDDSRVYLGWQLPKQGSERCYGLAADERYLMVSEYGEDGKDPELVVFKRRDR